MTVLDRVPVERITAEARQVEFGRMLLTLIGAVFYAVGWVAAKVFGVLWFAAAWSATAVKVGWQDGRSPRGREGG